MTAPDTELTHSGPGQPAPLAYTAHKFADETGLPYLSVLRLMRVGDLEFVQAGRYKLIPDWAARKFLRTPD